MNGCDRRFNFDGFILLQSPNYYWGHMDVIHDAAFTFLQLVGIGNKKSYLVRKD